MADPLSIASGIGGLVTLTDLVFCRIFKYVQAVKGASKEISALSSEVGALYGILSSLQLVCQQLDPKVFVATTLRTHHINSCTQTLEKMRMILDKDSTSSLQTQTIESIKRKLRWPFSSSEVKILLAECERHKTALGLALKADSMSGLVQLLSNQDDIRDTVNEINTYVKQRHEADTRIAINEKRQSILNSFGTTDPSKNQKMGLKLRQPGTGLWLIESQEYRHWAQTDGSKLWLQGIPGAGKTVLAATVIEEILRESNSNHAVAFYYCDYKDSATQMPNFILGSLVQQIAKQDEESFKKVKLFCDAHNPEYKDNVLYDPQELRDLICNLTISFNQATIVVDGLDECGVNAGEVTELLASLNQKDKVTELLASINQEDKETNIKTLFLSRNEVEIREHLEDYAEIAIAARSSDLRLYVGAEMDARTRNHKLRIKDQSLKDYIMEKLVEGAEGMYLGDDDTGEFALYRVGPGHDKNDLAKVCLTYLNFCDFDQGLYINATVTNRRFNDYPFRRYAVHHWYDLARPQLADRELFLLAKQLLKPSKTGTLLSWLQDRIVLWLDKKMDDDDHWWLDEMNRAIAEATTLHFAAMLSLPEVCTWLIDSGDCDINRASGFGTPLHCSLMTLGGAVDQLFDKELFDPWESCRRMEEGEMEEQGRVFEILLAAGADPNCYQGTLSPLLSPLFLSLELWKFDTASQLIDKGARLDEHCLELLESVIDTIGENDLDYEIQGVIDRIQSQPVEARDYSRTLRLIDKFGSSGNATGMPGINKAKQFTKPEFESILRVAAEFGQMEVIDQILGGQSVDLRAAEEETGLTALHYAAMNDHLNVVKLLLSHGADPYEVDCNGKNAIHHAISSVGVRCLEHLVEKVSTDTLLDAQGLSLWHWAAVTQTKQALETLAKYSTPMPSLSSMRTKDGWPPLLSAASVGSTENIDWLLHAGCTTMDKAYDGSTALHLAARSGFSDAVRVLLRNGSEVNAVTNDGSTVLHFALLDLKEGISAVLKLLIGQGLDVSHARVDGVMPIHLLLSHCANMTLTYENGHDHGLSTPESGWLLEAFGILVSDTDLGRKNSAGKSTLHLLADTWQNLSLDLSSRGKSEPNYTATRMMHMALDCASLTENSQRVCANPGLTIAALTIQDEQLAYKFLKHLPDVDVVTGDSSIIKAACLNGCSFTLLQEVLSRSKIQSENKQVSGLVRAVCRAKATKSRHKFMKILMNAGLSPNDSCPSSGKTPLMIAAHDGNTELMKVLLSNGADIHALDMDGNNVAHYACMGGYLKAVQILKPSTVNWNKKGTFRISSVLFKGANPLHIAAAALYFTFFYKVLWVKTKLRWLSFWYFKVLRLRALRAEGGL
ncbi:MAG: hypothetical protein L6R42_002600 [Xanthoria sp. 1 TBL-2021]|nr:MAG: hypothetical protein L6R42_002600 [Xanthoria sp. 1 TBL-2021]